MCRAGWIGLLVQDGLCAGDLNLHSKDLTTPCNSLFSLLLSLCDNHIRLSPASLQNSTSSTPAQQPDTCSQCFFLGSEDGEHQPPPPAKWPTVHADEDLNQNASVFPSLILCRSKRATLPPASAAPSSVPYYYHCFYPSLSTSLPSFPVLCFRLYA